MFFKKQKFSEKVLSVLLTILLMLQIIGGVLFAPPIKPAQAAANNWTFTTSSNYTFDSDKIEFSSGQAQLKATTSPAWYDTSWQYRNQIQITENSNENLTNYQVKIEIQGTDSGAADYLDFSKIKANGADVRFTSSDGQTLIDYWIESWDDTPSSEDATIWVETPSISASSASNIYAYYGNGAVSAVSNYSNTMSKLTTDSDYLGLYHADEGSGTNINDESTNNYDMILSNAAAWVGADGGVSGLGASSQFNSGDSLDFAGTYYATVDTVLDTPPDNGQVSFWFKFDNTFDSSATSDYRLFSKKNSSSPINLIDLYADSVSGALIFRKYNNDDAQTISTSKTSWAGGTWFHVRVAWGYEGLFIYINNSLTDGAANYGVQDSFGNGTLTDFTWGALDNGTSIFQYFPGEMDELEISSIHRSTRRSSADYERRKIVSDPWVEYAGNPVIGPDIDDWSDRWIAEMNVFKEGGIYKAIFKGGNIDGGDNVGVMYATSSDGYNWVSGGSNPVISDHLRAYVMKEKINGKWYLYVIDDAGGAHSYYTLFTSDELAGPWISQGHVLALGASGEWDDNRLGNLAVIKEGSDWYMWYEATDGGEWSIGYATSSDGENWTKYGSNPIIDGGSNSRGGPNVYKIGNTYYMIAHKGLAGGTPTTVTWFISSDRISWTEQSPNPIIQRNADANKSQLADPNIFEDTDKTLMYVTAFPYQGQTTNRIWAYIADGQTLYQALYPEPSDSIGSEATAYDSNNPTIQPTAANSQTFTSLSAFTETATKNSGEIKYVLSNDDGASWQYYNSGWTSSDGTYSQANTATDVNTNIASFPTGGGDFLFKAFLNSDGSQLVQLDSIQLTYNNAPSATFDNDFASWNSGNVTVNYNLIDAESETLNISQGVSSGIEYSTDISTWLDATDAGGASEGLTGLSSSASPGENHIFVWDSATDLASTEDSTVYLRLKPNDGTADASSWLTSNAFGLDNVAPSSVGAPTFGTIAATSIVINKPSTVTENGSGLNQWQARRDGATELGLISTSTTSITNSSLSENTQYTYDVQFTDAVANTSSYGTSANKYTLADTPTNLSLTAQSATTINISVDTFPNHSSGTSGYYFSNTTRPTNSGWQSGDSAWFETDLAVNTQYTYTVKYRNGDSTETSTIEQSSYTLIQTPTAISFDTIAVDSITVSATGVLSNLTSDSSGLYFDETSGSAGGADSSWLQTNSYQNAGLAENTQYTYRVKARNGDSTGTDYTATSSSYTLVDTPANLTGAAQSVSQINLSVDSFPNDAAGSSGYYFSNTTAGTNSGWTTTNSWQDTGLTCGTSYDYTVKYRNGDGTDANAISLTKSTNGCGGSAISTTPPQPPAPTAGNPQGGFQVLINTDSNINANHSAAIAVSSRKIDLNFNAGSDIKKMAISNTPDFKGAGLEDYQPNREWDICSLASNLIKLKDCPEGDYTIYVKFYTAGGQATEVISKTVQFASAAAPAPDRQFNAGALVKEIGQPAVYLIENGQKRPIFNERVFESYNFSWSDILEIDDLSDYPNGEMIGSPELSTSGGAAISLPSAIFTKPLYRGLRNSDVRHLQELLASQPDIYPEGLITGYFGPLTQKAVRRFQMKHKLVTSKNDPGYGYVGPKTRAKLGEVFGE